MIADKIYHSVDVHVAGGAFRIIKDGPLIRYDSMKHIHNNFHSDYAAEISLLMNEPRGFAGLNGCLVIPPFNPSADVGAVFFTHTETGPLHYGALAAVVTALLESGQLPPRSDGLYRIETAAGIQCVAAVMEEGEAVSVRLQSVVYKPAGYSSGKFGQAALIDGDKLYAVVKRDERQPELRLEMVSELASWGRGAGRDICTACQADELVLLDASCSASGTVRSITFKSDGYMVRSPGIGASFACAALLSEEGKLSGKTLYNESLFHSRIGVLDGEQVGLGYRFKAQTRGFITGLHTFVLDPTDPFASGFLLK